MPIWLIYALGTVCCWGAYGTAIHKSNSLLGEGLKTALLVGVAYFFLAVLIPGLIMWKNGIEWSFPAKGTMFGLLAGSLGAIGAICVIYSMKSGGSPLYVMPIIFGCAPLVNVVVSSIAHPPADGLKAINPLFWLGVLVLASGAGMVLTFKPE